MTFLFCGFVFDSSDDEGREMPVASTNYWLPESTKILNLHGGNATNGWMPPYTKVQGANTNVDGFDAIQQSQQQCRNINAPLSTTAIVPNNNININNNNKINNNHNGSGVMILEECRGQSTTTARRFLRWFGRIGQPVMGKSGKFHGNLTENFHQ
ncbi:hypothetical protein PV325_009785 [Microctonus aethiopoides]|nr:hypothetical protein PV325_009785 [Microctonus aethiopoides]